MKSRWNDHEAQAFQDDPIALRVYTSRLLGQEPDLVLHGGGNTSVKHMATDIFGDRHEALFVKGSGWDLATIKAPGFAPVRLGVLQRLARLEKLSDTEMVKAQRAALLDPYAPNPSVEAILHAILPFRFVDHTHADAVVTITKTPGGEERIREIYRSRVLIVPYVMPGFILAKTIYEMTRQADWSALEGIILLNHGAFTFDDDARKSYEKMIALVSEAEDYLTSKDTVKRAEAPPEPAEPLQLAAIRKAVAAQRGAPVLARLDDSPPAAGFSQLPDVATIATRGPLTPDHIIRTKQVPVIIGEDAEQAMVEFAESYRAYFDRNNNGTLTCLDSAPRWAVWPGKGMLAFGRNLNECSIISDITAHTIKTVQQAEALGGWQALPENDLFEVEYWELEQAKLKKTGAAPEFQGKIAMVTGAASGIGKACAEMLLEMGAAVAALDINPQIQQQFDHVQALGLPCDITNREAVHQAIETVVRQFGGVDVLISNAGIFPKSESLETMQAATWQRSLEVNLTGHQIVLQQCIPFLKQGIDPAAVVIASKNVPAPGRGAGAYSAAKAALTQLARVAALELASSGIRVNLLHPDAVFDTGVWSEEVLQSRAKHYGLSVEQYKTKNLLRTEVTSRDVARLACAMAGKAFAKTTGAQVPVDGGNERVI